MSGKVQNFEMENVIPGYVALSCFQIITELTVHCIIQLYKASSTLSHQGYLLKLLKYSANNKYKLFAGQQIYLRKGIPYVLESLNFSLGRDHFSSNFLSLKL